MRGRRLIDHREDGTYRWSECNRQWMKLYHTRSNVPIRVRSEVVKAWEGLWRKLRKQPEPDRRVAFMLGVELKVGTSLYKMRWDRRSRVWMVSLPGHVVTDGKTTYYVREGGNEFGVPGSCAFDSWKPYAYLDDLQDALDALEVFAVMEA